jgi:hypothetical protein
MEGDQTVPNVLNNNLKVNKTTAAGSVSLNPSAAYTVVAVAKKAGYNDSNPSNAVNVVFSPAINLAGSVGQNEIYGQGWKYADSVYTILDGADVTVSGVTTTRRLESEAGATADLTLNNVYITAITTGSAFTLNTGANITMTLAGTNELKTATAGAAGVQTTGASLTIEGTGSLAAQGGDSSSDSSSNNRSYSGAGIGGGGPNGAGGTVTISGSAVVTAQGGTSSVNSNGSLTYSGAGIGGGGGTSGVGGTITISGSAVVTAQGGGGNWGGAGIGGGAIGMGGSVTISGSAVVTAQGGGGNWGGAGIGGGAIGAGGSVTILGGTVIARHGAGNSVGSGIGIGGGYDGTTGTIAPPQNAVVFASSSDGLTNNLSNGISVGSATIAVDGTYPSFTTTVTLQNNMTVLSGATLTVPAGLILNKNGKTVTGSVVNTGGIIIN